MKKFYEVKIFFLLIFIFSSIESFAESDLSLSVKFGIFQFHTSKELMIKEETRKIPYRPIGPNVKSFQLYGFTVREKNGKPFTGHLIHYYPGPSISWLPFDNPEGEKVRRTVSQFEPEYVPEGGWTMIEVLHPGDPLGKHRMEIHINGELYKTIEFEVVEPAGR